MHCPAKAGLLIKYPGDEWVDVFGLDVYQRNRTNEKFIADIDKMLSTLEYIAKEKNKFRQHLVDRYIFERNRKA